MGEVRCEKSNLGNSYIISRSCPAKRKDNHTSACAHFPTSYHSLWWEMIRMFVLNTK